MIIPGFFWAFLAEQDRNTWCHGLAGRLIFIHHQCWEVLPFWRFQRQRCIKIRVLRAQDFYTPLALKTAKGQLLPALVVYKNQSPISGPTSTIILSRYNVAPHSVALCFPGFGGVSQENRATPLKLPVAPASSALKRGVALQVASWKVSWYRGVSVAATLSPVALQWAT